MFLDASENQRGGVTGIKRLGLDQSVSLPAFSLRLQNYLGVSDTSNKQHRAGVGRGRAVTSWAVLTVTAAPMSPCTSASPVDLT